MQLELFAFDEIKECFACTCNGLLRQANDLLMRLDSRFNYVMDCYCAAIDSFHAFYFFGKRRCSK